MKGDELGGVCDRNGERREMVRGFARKLGSHLEELVIDGKILLYWVLKKQDDVAFENF
jgi:hypothetical protein